MTPISVPVSEAPVQSHRILVAPDKFKASLRASDVANALATGIHARDRSIVVHQQPVADGGEGTLDVALAAGFTYSGATVTGPLMASVDSGFVRRGATAVIELAHACGMGRLPGGRFAPLESSTMGVGDLVRIALDQGCREIVVGAGGSCSTDGGMGLVAALGAHFLDATGEALAPCGANLRAVQRIDLGNVDPRLKHARLTVATDVDNPLLGMSGAARVYGPQKGASAAEIELLEAGLANLVRVARHDLGVDPSQQPGAGAAGGVGFAAIALLGAHVEPGIEVLLNLLGFDQALRDAHLVLIGEGSLDHQSLRGKAPIGVARAAGLTGVPVVAIVGQHSLSARDLADCGIAAVYSLTDIEPDLNLCMSGAASLLERLAFDNLPAWLKFSTLHNPSMPAPRD